jgi:hypothetical protein
LAGGGNGAFRIDEVESSREISGTIEIDSEMAELCWKSDEGENDLEAELGASLRDVTIDDFAVCAGALVLVFGGVMEDDLEEVEVVDVFLVFASRTFSFGTVPRRLARIKESTARGTTEAVCPHVARCI